MGKTNKTLHLVVDDSLLGLEPFKALKEQGHIIRALSSVTGEEMMLADMILSPKAWRMSPETVKYLHTAIKGVRLEAHRTEKGN